MQQSNEHSRTRGLVIQLQWHHTRGIEASKDMCGLMSERTGQATELNQESSRSLTCETIPKAWPRGTMVALWMGLAPCVCMATRACPDSWYAVSLRASAVCTSDLHISRGYAVSHQLAVLVPASLKLCLRESGSTCAAHA